uniref:Putative secreted protein n=1 Tax=Ixodes ricinus TaxID=34613 RepID=A0A6B0UDD3_IXORI
MTCPMWSQCHTQRLFPCLLRLWASSFSWCGNARSLPPVWMSTESPSNSLAMAEHSMCQPGRPGPHGDVHWGSPGLAPFQRAKSRGSRLTPGSTDDPMPGARNSP